MKTNILLHLLDSSKIEFSRENREITYFKEWRKWTLSFCFKEGESTCSEFELYKEDEDVKLTDKQEQIFYEFALSNLNNEIKEQDTMQDDMDVIGYHY